MIDVTTHLFEPPRTWVAEIEIENTLLQSGIYGIEFATRELIEHANQELVIRVKSLYTYTRFEDEKLSSACKTMETSFEHYPEGPINTIKHKATFVWARAHCLSCRLTRKILRGKIIGLPNFPKRLLPKLSTREVVTWQDQQIHILRVQESLLAQIALFYKYDLEPQAVLVHPAMARQLIAVRALPEYEGLYQCAVTCDDKASFAGLSVIECQELAQGAMVV